MLRQVEHFDAVIILLLTITYRLHLPVAGRFRTSAFMAAGRFWTDGRFNTPRLFLLIVLRNTALDRLVKRSLMAGK